MKEKIDIAKLKQQYPYANTVVVILAIIMLWRGVWGLLDEFLFPGSPVLSYLASFGLGILILYLDGFSLDDLKK